MIKLYRNYKSFNFESFKNKLKELQKSEKDINYSLFENIFPSTCEEENSKV